MLNNNNIAVLKRTFFVIYSFCDLIVSPHWGLHNYCASQRQRWSVTDAASVRSANEKMHLIKTEHLPGNKMKMTGPKNIPNRRNAMLSTSKRRCIGTLNHNVHLIPMIHQSHVNFHELFYKTLKFDNLLLIFFCWNVLFYSIQDFGSW